MCPTAHAVSYAKRGSMIDRIVPSGPSSPVISNDNLLSGGMVTPLLVTAEWFPQVLPSEALEIYATGLADAIGGRLAELLYFGKAPGYSDWGRLSNEGTIREMKVVDAC